MSALLRPLLLALLCAALGSAFVLPSQPVGIPSCSPSGACAVKMSTTSPPVVSRSTITCLSPGAKVGKPKVSLAKGVGLAAPESQSKQKQKEKTTKKSKRVTQEDNVPMFKVLLLGDEGYQREHVLLACQEIIPECDNKRSVEIFEEAQKTGQSLCGVYPEEEAELYVQQFTRAEPMIFSELEEE